MLKLWQLADAYEQASAWIEEHSEEIQAAGGEIPPELAEILDAIDDDFATKVERVGLVIRQMEASAKVAKSEADRLAALASSYENGADSLKEYCRLNMMRVGTLKVDGALVKIWVQKNGRPSIRPADPSNPPAKYQRVRMFGACSPEAWKNIAEACEIVGVGPPEHAEEFDAGRAYEDLKAAGLLPDDPGSYEIDGLHVDRGTHLRTR